MNTSGQHFSIGALIYMVIIQLRGAAREGHLKVLIHPLI
ncbi:MAG: hypothetical protein AVDCRST_MAG37-1613 [uncultured Rubrobacteraceae bacterium]|uniref:Uncharacterized protein n=1 Tax=uncultured Rubrobacteraceae bacterium TaxID=349277 RepID=A0A6J4QGU4_9ACTN|nr:MAG: hypothetical protein AVDCRST_MAG37-1613 [uncultured Rubrobacteraceae bacterium]